MILHHPTSISWTCSTLFAVNDFFITRRITRNYSWGSDRYLNNDFERRV
jgi:hypothetical protein